MFLDKIFLLIIIIALSVPMYWAVPKKTFYIRQGILVLLSIVMLTNIGMYLWLVPLVLFLCVTVFAILLRVGVSVRVLRILSWGIFVPLFAQDWLPGLGTKSLVTASGFSMLGLGYGFATLRAFLCIRVLVAERKFDPGAALTALYFFPSYLTGPLAGSSYFSSDACATRLAGRDAVFALSRIGVGAAMFLVLRPVVLGWDLGLPTDSVWSAWAGVLQRFIALYLDFAGYSEVAIGVALLFGFGLPENFRAPLFSRSIRDFWQRWHLSLGVLIATYLARPLTRRSGSPSLAIFVSFVLVGLWHATTLNYLAWGAAHGAALAFQSRLGVLVEKMQLPRSFVNFAGWITTISYVTMWSAVANAPSAAAGWMVFAQLFGLS